MSRMPYLLFAALIVAVHGPFAMSQDTSADAPESPDAEEAQPSAESPGSSPDWEKVLEQIRRQDGKNWGFNPCNFETPPPGCPKKDLTWG